MKNRLQNKMLETACQDIVLEGAERAVQACPRSRQLDGDLARDACVEDGRARSCVKLHASLSNRRRCLRRGICWRCRAPLVVGRRAREDRPSAQSILPQMVFLRAVGSISFPPAEYGRCAASEAVAGSPSPLTPSRFPSRFRERSSAASLGRLASPSSMPDAARAGPSASPSRFRPSWPGVHASERTSPHVDVKARPRVARRSTPVER